MSLTSIVSSMMWYSSISIRSSVSRFPAVERLLAKPPAAKASFEGARTVLLPSRSWSKKVPPAGVAWRNVKAEPRVVRPASLNAFQHENTNTAHIAAPSSGPVHLVTHSIAEITLVMYWSVLLCANVGISAAKTTVAIVHFMAEQIYRNDDMRLLLAVSGSRTMMSTYLLRLCFIGD